MLKSGRQSFQEWVAVVNAMANVHFDATLVDLEQDVPLDELERAYHEGCSPRRFVETVVAAAFEADEEATGSPVGRITPLPMLNVRLRHQSWPHPQAKKPSNQPSSRIINGRIDLADQSRPNEQDRLVIVTEEGEIVEILADRRGRGLIEFLYEPVRIMGDLFRLDDGTLTIRVRECQKHHADLEAWLGEDLDSPYDQSSDESAEY